MIKRLFSIAALSMMVAACGGDDADEADANADSTATSVTTVPGTDTSMQPVEVQTTDSIVTNTTVSTDTDTIEGEAEDTTPKQP